MNWIGNAFSLNMLGLVEGEPCYTLSVRRISLADAREWCDGRIVRSAIGHADTAAILGDLLGESLIPARVTVLLHEGETILVGQYRGPRLPEGTTKLPEGAVIEWLLVTVSA